MNYRTNAAMKETQTSSEESGHVSGFRHSQKQIWSIGGGKGGIGKSFISTSVAISLAQNGQKVILIDLDLGGANLHTCLGTEVPTKTLSDYFSGRAPSLESIVVDINIPNLRLISGANDALNVASIALSLREKLMKEIRGLNSDFIILDLGAGTTDHTLDFFLMADKQICALVPEPTSIENAYRFIKSAFFRKLQITENILGIRNLIDEAMDHKNSKGIRSPADLVRYVSHMDPIVGRKLEKEIVSFRLNLIVNQVRTHSDIEVGHSIVSVCRRYFGIEANYVGYLDFDNAVWQCLRKRRPLLLECPNAMVAGQFQRITKSLVDPKKIQGTI
jgi:flagellar biosynthesis protein FlhG